MESNRKLESNRKIESLDAATLSYSLEHLQFYNIQAYQNQRFINLKKHLKFSRTFKGIWSDGRHVICLDEDLAGDTFVYYDPFRSGYTILDDILDKFKDASSLDITERTKRHSSSYFKKKLIMVYRLLVFKIQINTTSMIPKKSTTCNHYHQICRHTSMTNASQSANLSP